MYVQNVVKAGAEIIEDRAEFIDPHTVQLKKSGRKVTAERFLIATGGHPSHEANSIEGWENCITSNDAFYLEKLPRRIVVAGGGYIGVEFAHIFHGLGCDVTLICRNPKVLRGFDEDLRDCLMAEMHTNGIRVLTERNIKRVDKKGDEVFVFTDKDDMIEADCAMLAIGRHPNTRGLGLDKAGVKTGKHEAVAVDEYSKSNVDHIYAIGDVTDRLQLTPVAIHEAMCFVKTVFEGKPTPVDHHLVPTAVFSRPEIATVGMTEAQALEKGHAIDVYQSTFRPLKHTLSGRNTRARFKLVVDTKTHKVLGCHIFGFDAAEIIQMATVALKMGATKENFDSAIALHPTAAEELVTMRTKNYSKP
jgi:glutathione reductase (NADPH)